MCIHIRGVSICFLFLILFSVGGCTSYGEKLSTSKEYAAIDIESMANKEVCCESYTEIDFSPLKVGERLQVDFPREGGLPRRFRSGPSYFEGFVIPEPVNGSGQTLVVRSVLMARSGGTGRVFVPTIKLLDASPNGDEIVFEPKLCYERMWWEVGYFTAVEIPSEVTGRGLLYTDFSRLDELQRYFSTATVGYGIVPITTSTDHFKVRTTDAEVEIWIADEDDSALRQMSSACIVELADYLD